MEKVPTENEEIARNSDALQSSEKQGSKQQNGLKIVTIICAVLAVAGIGFGVYGFFFKKSETPTQNTDTLNLESELASYKQKYSVLQNYVKELEASGTEVSEEVKSATSETDTGDIKQCVEATIVSGSGASQEDGYFYLNEWGIKVKLAEGENYKVLGYLYNSEAKAPDESQGTYEVWGGSYTAENSDAFVGFYPSVSDNSSLTVVRYITELIPHYAVYGEFHKVWTDEKYTYYAVNPNGVSVTDNSLQLKIVDFWKNSGFMDANNYSAI